MIVAVASTKGGVGKTTIAVNIAVTRANRFGDVLLVDGDPQDSAADFTALRAELRGSLRYTIARLRGKELLTQVRGLAGKFDDVIIDVGSRDGASLRAALLCADTVAIPVCPRTFDMWATAELGGIIEEARIVNPGLRAVGFLNIAYPGGAGNKANAEAMESLREMVGIEALNTVVVQRKAFQNATVRGMAVTEMKRDPKAAGEMDSLIEEIFE